MKLKHLFALAGFIVGGGNLWAQTAWTGNITNADGLTFTTKYADPSNNDVAETWTGASSTTHAFDVNQSLTSVPDGVYELSAQAMYRASLAYGTATNCVLYATVGSDTYSTPISNFADYTAKEDRAQIGTQMKNNNAYLNKIPAVIVEGGSVTIGMKSIGELAYCTNGYWFVYKKSTFTFKDVTSEYHAKLLARANTILESAPESDAKTTFRDAVTNYSTANLANIKSLQAAITTFLETATVDAPLNVTDYITNPSFNDDSGNKKNWIQDLGYKQPSDIYQPTGWNMLYSSATVNNTQYQTYKTQTDNAKEGNCYYVRHRWGDVYAKVSLHQLVKELPAGVYKLSVAVKGGSNVTDANTLTMKAGSNSNFTTVADFDKTNYKDYDVQVTKAEADEDLDISFAWDQKTGNEQLYYVDDFRLYYLGDPVKVKKAELLALQATIDDYLKDNTYVNVVGEERTNLTSAKSTTATEETIAAYETAIKDVQLTINTFTAAKTNYDDLIREIEKATTLGIDASSYAPTSTTTAETALTSTQNLKVKEYNYVTNTYQYGVDLGEWTSTATNTKAADFSNEHWSGTTHSYKNQDDSNGQGWNANSWEINFNQDVVLPAGNYVFKVAARQASDEHVTTSLIVKIGENTLGTVSDFPRSNNARGINKEGATSFDPEDTAGFANKGNGYGWEWRYVKFTLAEDATVNIAVNSKATAAHCWVSFGDYTLQTDNEANISLIAYNIALASAKTTIANTDYTNVTGSEKTALQNAIDADGTLDKTDNDAIVAATTALDNARKAFVDAKSAYDTFVAAKGKKYENDLAYASATKFADIATAQAAADATSAEDATSKTNAILSAYRKYVESHALAEGVKDAEQITIPEANFDGLTTSSEGYDPNNWKISENWFLDGQNNGAISFNITNTVIDGDGNSNYNYIRIQKSDNNAGIHQAINLLPGKYMMTATVRCQSGQGAKFEAFAGDVWVDAPQADNVGGTFDHGWNDVNVEFSVYETKEITFGVKSNYGRNIWWNATRFRLVKLADIEEVTIDEASENAPDATTDPVNVTLTRTLSKDYWNTFCSPVAITADEIKAKFGEDTKVREMDTDADVVDNVIPFKDATSIVAGVPYLVKPAQTVTNPTFAGKTVVNEAQTVANGDSKYIGILTKTHLDAPATDATALDLYLSTDGTMKKPSTNGANLKGMRAYFNVPVAAAEIGVKLFLGEDVDAITVIDGEPVAGAAIYNLAGQRIAAPQKGVNIIGGKKVLVK